MLVWIQLLSTEIPPTATVPGWICLLIYQGGEERLASQTLGPSCYPFPAVGQEVQTKWNIHGDWQVELKNLQALDCRRQISMAATVSFGRPARVVSIYICVWQRSCGIIVCLQRERKKEVTEHLFTLCEPIPQGSLSFSANRRFIFRFVWRLCQQVCGQSDATSPGQLWDVVYEVFFMSTLQCVEHDQTLCAYLAIFVISSSSESQHECVLSIHFTIPESR